MESIHEENDKAASDRKRTKKKALGQSDGSSLALKRLKYAIAPATFGSYTTRLRKLFTSLGLSGSSSVDEQAEAFLKMARKKGARWVQDSIMDFIEKEISRMENEGKAPGTVQNSYFPIKAFIDANDQKLFEEISWRILEKGLPSRNTSGEDRSPTKVEIRTLLEYGDHRLKAFLLVMCSTGIRLGAWPSLKWKHVEAKRNEKGEVIAARLLVYAGVPKEEHIAFMTPEAFNTLKAYIDFRKLHNETITGESWLLRDTWQTTNVKHGAVKGLATNPKVLGESGIKHMMDRALKAVRLRTSLPEGETRYDWKMDHGFRKFYETQAAEAKMYPKAIDKLLNHHIGYDRNYYKPTEEQLLQEYLVAVPFLTITDFEKSVLLQKVEVLEAEKDGKLERMQKQIEFLLEHALVEHLPGSSDWIEKQKSRLQDPSDQYLDQHGNPHPPEAVEQINEVKQHELGFLEMLGAYKRQKEKEEAQSTGSENNP